MFLDDDSDEVVSNYSEKRQLASMAATIAAGLVTNSPDTQIALRAVLIAKEILKILKDST